MQEYLVQGFGGVAHPDLPSLQTWMNELAKDGWVLVAVDANVGYFAREMPAPRHGRDRHHS